MGALPRWCPAGLLLLAACGGRQPDRAHVETLFGLDANRLPPVVAPRGHAELGARLFDHPFRAGACADCHPRSRAGQDGRTHLRNTPALADVARQTLFGWGGEHAGLSEMVRAELVRRLGFEDDASLRAAVAANEGLARGFEVAFPGEQPTLDHAARALAAELSTWRTHGRWDRYVEGDDSALSPAERAGLATFLEVGCATCHGGRNLGGGSVHLLGLARPFPTSDPGRAAATGNPNDRGHFKAPMLRHAAATPPYLHDGSVAELDGAVRLMGRHELGVELRPEQVSAIVTLLRATAEVDAPRPLPGSIR